MARCVHDLAGALMTERISLALVTRMGRSKAHDTVAEAVRRARDKSGSALRSALLSNHEVAKVVSESELAELLEPSGYLGASDTWIDRALARYGESAEQ